jgi:molybdate transport system ATP-binding protein
VLELMTRADLPLAHGDSAGALVEAVTCGLQSDSDLCELRFDGGTLLLPQTRATPLPDRTPVRVRIQARDVSLSLVLPEQTSVLNCLPATVADVSEDGPGQVLVGLRLGQDTRLLSRISRLSCERLGVAPGLPVYAQIKGVAMVR